MKASLFARLLALTSSPLRLMRMLDDAGWHNTLLQGRHRRALARECDHSAGQWNFQPHLQGFAI